MGSTQELVQFALFTPLSKGFFITDRTKRSYERARAIRKNMVRESKRTVSVPEERYFIPALTMEDVRFLSPKFWEFT